MVKIRSKCCNILIWNSKISLQSSNILKLFLFLASYWWTCIINICSNEKVQNHENHKLQKIWVKIIMEWICLLEIIHFILDFIKILCKSTVSVGLSNHSCRFFFGQKNTKFLHNLTHKIEKQNRRVHWRRTIQNQNFIFVLPQ